MTIKSLGFKGKSALFNLGNFNFVKQVPLDYMHLLCLGVTKRMFGQTYNIDHSTIQTKRIKVKRLPIASWNDVIMRQRQPSDLNRRSRIMDYKNMKASEWRTVSICTALHIMDQSKDPSVKDCWLMYFWIVRTYLITTDAELRDINNYIDMGEFIKQWKLLYEEIYSQYNCSYNVHCVEHLPSERENGSLVDSSSFPFEGVYGTMLTALCPGTMNTTRQANLGTFITFRGRRGRHICQNALRIQHFKSKSMHDDSLIYTQDGFWSVTKVNQKDKVFMCHRLNVRPLSMPCKFGVRDSLNMSLIGVYKYHSVDNEVHATFHFKDVLGKFMRIADNIVKLPKDILLECTWLYWNKWFQMQTISSLQGFLIYDTLTYMLMVMSVISLEEPLVSIVEDGLHIWDGIAVHVVQVVWPIQLLYEDSQSGGGYFLHYVRLEVPGPEVTSI